MTWSQHADADRLRGGRRSVGPLTAVPGTWDDGATFTYQWFAGEDAIAGATGPTYDVRWPSSASGSGSR